ncbi:hypothetical protein AB0N81_10530 [Streptomyces sp. NPDC093510]|uniref:hypothetical protein n=1 Tax=Streptomyces sp. NPDC093510 TaxID=3155199 RepID=UPI00344411FD
MRRNLSSTNAVARRSSRRPWFACAATAVALLALGACGTENTATKHDGGERAGRADTVGGRAEAAFPAMLERIARSCPPSAPPKTPPAAPVNPASPAPGETPSDRPVEPVTPTSGPEVELNARDWCAAAHHEERVTRALWDLADPTPAEVRTVLNDLGYVDERIHGLKRSGGTTRFTLDLRDKGGRLCVEGSAAGERTIVEACVAPESGPFGSAGHKA